ncbi:hypothetical protein OAH85_03505 [Paracoccaceae bacterium]|nr:hypothetical protein [Paracoccaceae bacterium]
MATNFRWVTKINEDKRSYLTFLPKGDAYKLFGVIKSDRHLFGLEEGKLHVFGTDEDGQDIFSRTLHAIWTSLQVGTIGVLIAFVLALIIGGGVRLLRWLDRQRDTNDHRCFSNGAGNSAIHGRSSLYAA